MTKEEKNLFLIDGHALCYRAYYAIKELNTSKGVPTNAVYGFVAIMRKLMNKYDPELLAVAFDTKAPTERHKKYKEYKIHRKPMPEDLVSQIPIIKDIVRAFNIPVFQMEGYEADDIIATLAGQARKAGLEVTVVTSDKDALQLVDNKVKVLSSHTMGEKMYGPDEVVNKYGIGPDLMVDMMALMGDASDNIPGVRGIGQVTASKLINKYGSLDGIYDNLNDISSDTLKKKLSDGRELAYMSRDLVVLNEDVPVKLDVKAVEKGKPDTDKLVEIYTELEFDKLLSEVLPEKKKNGEYRLLSNGDDIIKIVEDIREKGIVSISPGRSCSGGNIGGLALSVVEGEAVFLPSGGDGRAEKAYKEILEDENIKKIGFDIKKNIRFFKEHRIPLKGIYFDVMIADYLIDPSRTRYDLEAVVLRHMGYNVKDKDPGIEWDTSGQGAMDLSGETLYMPVCEKSDIILRIFNKLMPLLGKNNLLDLFEKLEMPLVKILADIEDEGVGIDIKCLERGSDKLDKELEKTSKKIYKLAGEKFNINSPKQLQVILYERLGLPAVKKTKTGFSTDESVLKKLEPLHELPKVLLYYREMNKLKTGYYDSILSLVDKETCKLHANFNQAVTATGRLSSSEPNLQNIPIKTEMGKEIRRAFIPGGKGKVLMAVDYSQIELRVLAHLSLDKNLIRAFRKEEDIHSFTASLIFDVPLDEVTPEMRSAAKTVNFGIVYGMSSFGLSKDLGIRIDEAKEFIDAYFDRYAGIKTFMDNVIASARKDGFVTTLMGRRRYIPEINSTNERTKNFAERVAINTPVQGSAADIIKIAMIDCYDEFKGTEVRMTIQVHDELVFEVPERSVKSTAEKIKKIMEGVLPLEVPLKVDIESGPNWMDMEEIDL